MATKQPPEHYLPIWEKAAEEEIGLCIQVHPDDQMKLVNALYECRSIHGGFEDFMIFQPKPAGQIFIVRKTTELPT